MTSGKLVVVALLLATFGAGIGVWYAQSYAFYDRVDTAPEISVAMRDGTTSVLPIAAFEAIDADSSPLRFRACLNTEAAAFAEAQPYATPTPLNGPGWFDCYDAGALTADLAAGRATAYLSRADISPGFDRVIASYADGRAFVWHQPNGSAEETKRIE